MRIFLIGMPLSGKTTIAKELANSLGYQYHDLDELIIREEKETIDGIFKNKGEAFFRKMETRYLNKLINSLEANAVIALGGGTPIYNDLSNILGLIIYLAVSSETILNRMKMEHSRPLLNEKTINELFKERESIYKKFADAIIDNNNGIKRTLTLIKNEVKKHENTNY